MRRSVFPTEYYDGCAQRWRQQAHRLGPDGILEGLASEDVVGRVKSDGVGWRRPGAVSASREDGMAFSTGASFVNKGGQTAVGPTGLVSTVHGLSIYDLFCEPLAP